MPFIRTNVPHDTPAAMRNAIVQGIHQALVDAIGMPPDELFNLVAGYAPGEFACSPTFNGVARSDRVVVVEITLRRGRSDAMKRTLYAAIARNLQAMAGVGPPPPVQLFAENPHTFTS